MFINVINNHNNYYTPSFGVNLQSPKLCFKNDDFFVQIRGYGKNSNWAKKIIETADIAVKFIRTNLDFDSILRYISAGVRQANQFPLDLQKREHSSILRTERENWLGRTSDWSDYLVTSYEQKKCRYNSYRERLDSVYTKKLKNPYTKLFRKKTIMLSRPVIDKGRHYIQHASGKYVNNALDLTKNLYLDLHKNYIEKEAQVKDLDNINSTIAEIRWILAHATPWERGSDAIANTYIRAIYKAIGIKTTPLKKGISLDLEAYCTNLEDYKKNFSNYFVKPPYIVE